MRIQDSQFKHPPFDVATALGEYLISTGAFSDPSIQPRPVSVMTFGLLQDDLLTPPAITHSCSGCTLTGYTESKKGTAHLTPILHCGQSSLPGPEIAEAYIKAFKAYSRAVDAPQPQEKSKRVFFVPAVGA